MLKRFKSRREIRDRLDEQINAVLSEMSHHDPSSEEYGELVKRSTLLNDTKTNKGRGSLSADAILGGAVTLGSIGLIVFIEKTSLTNSRAYQFVKPKTP